MACNVLKFKICIMNCHVALCCSVLQCLVVCNVWHIEINNSVLIIIIKLIPIIPHMNSDTLDTTEKQFLENRANVNQTVEWAKVAIDGSIASGFETFYVYDAVRARARARARARGRESESEREQERARERERERESVCV